MEKEIIHYYDPNHKNKTFCNKEVSLCGLKDYKKIDTSTTIHSNGKLFILSTSPFHYTESLELITCECCKLEYKKYLIPIKYYCPDHGFLKSYEVTHDENCDICTNNACN